MKSIIAIDPSASLHMGLANCQGNHWRSEEILFDPTTPLPEYLVQMTSIVRDRIRQYEATHLVIEDTSMFGQNSSARRLAMTIGCLIGSATELGVETHLMVPAHWKKVLTGSGKADKKEVSDHVHQWINNHLTNEQVKGLNRKSQHAIDATGILIAFLRESQNDALELLGQEAY